MRFHRSCRGFWCSVLPISGHDRQFAAGVAQRTATEQYTRQSRGALVRRTPSNTRTNSGCDALSIALDTTARGELDTRRMPPRRSSPLSGEQEASACNRGAVYRAKKLESGGPNGSLCALRRFLGREPEKIGFCRRCDRPFVRGKKTLFCSLKCARANSSIRSRDQRNARKRSRGLKKAVKILDEWLQKSHRAGADWRLKTEKAFGLRETGNRYSRLMGEYIRASETPPGSPQREKLLCSLLSGSTIDPAERINVQQQLDGFLENISKANRRSH